MNEFIEKLIGRLEEAKEKHKPTVNGKTTTRDLEIYKMTIGYAEEIVNQLAEEYNNGWIPCDCPLVPTDYCIVQIQEDNGYLWIPKVGEYRASIGKWRIEGAFEHSNGWLEDTEHFKVIAWQPLPEPYRQKGGTE